MKKTIIVVSGKANIGKTKTIKKVAESILKKYKNDYGNIDILQQADIKIIITIEIVVEGTQIKNTVKVGISSGGDIANEVQSNLDYFIKEKCEVIICATRSKGEPVHLVNRTAEINGYKNIWVAPYYQTQDTKKYLDKRDELNELSAKHICEILDYVLTGA